MECICGEDLYFRKATLIMSDRNVAITSLICPKCGAAHQLTYGIQAYVRIFDKDGKEL